MMKCLHYNLILSALLAAPVFGEETILARTDVPNRFIPQGEIRLIDRSTEVVVQSAIKTRYPGKVFSKISKSEKKNWPGNPEMETYLSALEAAFAEYEKREKGTVLAIDFTAGPGGTRVDIRFPPAPVWRSLRLSAAYVQKNQEYILADAFGKKADAVIKKLRNLNPMDESNGK
jgi:hypothetical protein